MESTPRRQQTMTRWTNFEAKKCFQGHEIWVSILSSIWRHRPSGGVNYFLAKRVYILVARAACERRVVLASWKFGRNRSARLILVRLQNNNPARASRFFVICRLCTSMSWNLISFFFSYLQSFRINFLKNSPLFEKIIRIRVMKLSIHPHIEFLIQETGTGTPWEKAGKMAHHELVQHDAQILWQTFELNLILY